MSLQPETVEPLAKAVPGRPAYKRILLKLSGEALMGPDSYGINRPTIDRIVGEIAEILGLGVEVAVVIGGGNIFRGVAPAAAGMDRATADYMGMLATVMNALALQVAAGSPRYVKVEDVPSGAKLSPEEHKEQVLLEQAFIKDPGMTVKELLKQLIGKTGENVIIRRFSRFALGE